MGLENSVNGWFVTYLKSTGFMSASLATVVVSVTWIMIMIGRIVIASISKNAAGKDPGCDLRSSVCLGADPCIRRQYGDGGGSPGSSRSWHGGRIPDNDGLTGDLMEIPRLNVGVYGIGSGGILTPVIGVLADRLASRRRSCSWCWTLPSGTFGVGALRYAVKKDRYDKKLSFCIECHGVRSSDFL